MKSSEEAIEKVMAGLREAKASPGMERRILEAIEDRALARSRPGWRRWRPWLGMPAGRVTIRPSTWGLALASLLVAVVAIPSVSWMRHAPASPGVRVEGAVSQLRPAAPEQIAATPQLPRPEFAAQRVRRSGAKRSRPVKDGDSAAVRDTFADNHPAPPMPLTEQERLLLRIAHAGDPVELAMLNPEIRARREEQGEAEFEQFFPPPPPIKEKADDHL